ASAVLVFVVASVTSHRLLRLSVPAAIGAVGVYLMVDDRSAAEASSDDYAADSAEKVDGALSLIREIQKLSRDVSSPSARHSLQQAVESVPELLTRVRTTAPNSLYSSASQIGGHLVSLVGVLRQYLDIQRK